MNILIVLGEHQYGNPELGVGTEYAAFTSALRRLGHTVFHFESWNRTLYQTHADSNRMLLELVAKEPPDVLLSVQRDCEIWLETLEAIAYRGDVATISWTTDDSWKYERTSRYIGPSYSAMTTTYESMIQRYRNDNIPVLLTQWAANAEWLQAPLPASECTYSVSFVGAAYRERRQIVDALQRQGIRVECFGTGWPRGPVSAESIPSIMRHSLVSLNFAGAFIGAVNQIKARTFEVPGAGGLLLTDFSPGLDRFYEIGKEVLVYRNTNELAEKIAWVQNHPSQRDAIAMAGFLRTKRDHTYDQRMKDVLAFALASKNSHTRRGPPPRFDLALLRHRLPRWMALVRDLLVAATSMVWGRQRGPRAARRIVFEASLRLFGRNTYRAAGLPGRLFPEQ
jgi:spore maturation protein CgeB